MKTTPNARCLPGLEIQRVVEPHAETVARAAGVDDLGVQLGIETGLVVIGPIGGGSHQETGATGEGRERGAWMRCARSTNVLQQVVTLSASPGLGQRGANSASSMTTATRMAPDR